MVFLKRSRGWENYGIPVRSGGLERGATDYRSRADLGEQTRQALENLEIAVKAAGGTRTDIVSLRLYIVADHIHNTRSVSEALLGFFPAENLPATTWIGVSALASKDFLIEIEAVAVLE